MRIQSIYTIKLLSIIFTVTIYTIISFIATYGYKHIENYLFGNKNEIDNKTYIQLIAEIYASFVFIVVIIYIIKLGTGKVHFPLDGKFNFDYKEFSGRFTKSSCELIIGILIVSYSQLQQKINALTL